MLINLLSNAIKFSRNHETVSIQVQMIPKNIATRQILISVQDHGIGISEEDGKKLFSPFFKSADK